MSDIIPQDDAPRKQCTTCHEFLPATPAYFHRARKGKYGLHAECKKCKGHEKNFGYTPKECSEDEKECTGCHKVFPATPAYFSKSASQKIGLRSRCKKCEGKGANFGITKEIRPDEKQCTECKMWFPKTTQFFQVNRSLKDGFVSRCKKCGNGRRRKKYALPDTQWANKRRTPEFLERRRVYMQERRKRPGTIGRLREKERAISHNRRARQKAIAGIHTPEQISQQYDRQKGKCYYCQKKVKWGEHHVDHTFPISRVVGTDIPANSIDYLVITCEHCNESKGSKYPWEWPEGGRLL